MENTKLFNIMGCRPTKSGKGFNISLVHEDVDGKKTYANIYMGNDKCRKVYTESGKKGISLFIPIFEDKKVEDKKEDAEVPFTDGK